MLAELVERLGDLGVHVTNRHFVHPALTSTRGPEQPAPGGQPLDGQSADGTWPGGVAPWETAPVPATDPKADLMLYLQLARDALLWKLAGLSGYDGRHPLTTTGTNLLGLVKHATAVGIGYLCATFGRPAGRPLPWGDTNAEPGSDLWATGHESSGQMVDRYRQAWTRADSTITDLALDAVGQVPW